jgi:hypothetical protein
MCYLTQFQRDYFFRMCFYYFHSMKKIIGGMESWLLATVDPLQITKQMLFKPSILVSSHG